MRPAFYRLAIGSILFVMASQNAQAAEIQFIEDFALAEDRDRALEQLIPGTEDYYYFHCLHLQNLERFDEVETLLGRWIQQHHRTDRVREIQYRQSLLTYNAQPLKSLEFIRQELGIRFDHQREQQDRQSSLPSTLAPQLISRETLRELAFRQHNNLDGFKDAALEWLVAETLNPSQRRHLLERIRRPDIPGLVELVVADLNYKDSRGFGSLPIHGQLLRDQLEACLKLKPTLLNESNFVQTYITKLRADNDTNLQDDLQAYEAYLDRLQAFVDRLDPVHNSLKAHVLYHRLAFDLTQGVHNKKRFMAYLQLPRAVPYVARTFATSVEFQRNTANLAQDFGTVSGLPPVGQDETLVRAYLLHFFESETSYSSYEPLVDVDYLKRLFAEAKIVNGLGDAERWYAMLPPAQYQALRDRVDLDFAPENAQQYGPNESVAIDLYVKNVTNLLVKVYEINAANYFRQYGNDVNTDVNLDGLVANHEQTHAYDDGPLRRVRRRFEFPELNAPGTYVIDFIGNGLSSRVVVRKGKLDFLVATTIAGHEFKVLDEQHEVVSDARIWLAGHEYAAGEDGTIVVPFTNQPGTQPIVLLHGERASLHQFDHLSENYQLHVGFHVDRESLLRHRRATLLVRSSLHLNGVPVSLSELKEVTLTVTSTDHDGTSTSQTVPDFKLFEDREAEHTFHVPARLASLRFEITAKHRAESQSQDVSLQASQELHINEIDRTPQVSDVHLFQASDRYYVECLGKTGEALAARPVRVRLAHRDFNSPIDASLQTNDQGVVDLGPLEDIESIQVSAPGQAERSWTLAAGKGFAHFRSVHAPAQQTIRLPYDVANVDKVTRADVSLLEVCGDTYVNDRFDAITLVPGFLELTGLEAGDYDLLLKQSGTLIRVRVTEGEEIAGQLYGDARTLEVRNARPLQITAVDVHAEKIAIHLANATRFTRVHIFANRYEPAFDPYSMLGRIRDAEPNTRGNRIRRSLYASGRNIGDEYRYILERRYAEKFPGNMLQRPELLLNPWAIRGTETGQQEAQQGSNFAPATEAPPAADARAETRAGGVAFPTDFANLDYLDQASFVLLNVVADDDGVIEIDRQKLGPQQTFHVVAVDPVTTAYQRFSLPESTREFLDLRMTHVLAADKHFTQTKQVAVVPQGQAFTIRDPASSRFATYDSLTGVFQFYATIGSDPRIREFEFILQWHAMDDAAKHAKYSEHACHELNFFLFKKDPQFFATVIRPALANKLDKTFLDEWLLERDLAPYMDAWRYEQLNIVERILLGQRLEGEVTHLRAHITDLFELLPPQGDQWNALFETALLGHSLSGATRAGGAGGFGGGGDLGLVSGARRRLAALSEPAAAVELSDMAADKEVDEAELEQLKRKSSLARGRQRGVTADDGVDFFFAAPARSGRAPQFYQKLDATKEWAENNYYHVLIENQLADLVDVNGFWRDFAHHDPSDGFFSPRWIEATGNLSEMMFALAVLDL
ncbi:MAG: hypothetical protein KDA60_03820, partial [Planctomycetales bacterium]|nr:hypothetical protein [Planctomycetales bacterium]